MSKDITLNRRLKTTFVALILFVLTAFALILYYLNTKSNEYLLAEANQKMSSILDIQIPFIRTELAAKNFEKSRIRAQFTVANNRTDDLQIGLYDCDGKTIYESETLAEIAAGVQKQSSGVIENQDKRYVFMRRSLDYADQHVGDIVVAAELRQENLQLFSRALMMSVFVLIVVILITFFIINRFISKYLVKPVRALTQSAPEIHKYISGEQERLEMPRTLENEEVNVLSQTLEQFARNLRSALETNKETERKIAAQYAVNQLASKFAHELRGTLSTLRMILADHQKVPEAVRGLFHAPIQRISDLAKNLLSEDVKTILSEASLKKYQTEAPLSLTREEPKSQNLIPLIEEVLSEKRNAYGSDGSIRIDSIHETEFLVSSVVESEFKTVVSNIVQNAIDAIGTNGGVEVATKAHVTSIEVSVSDSGSGIDPSIQSKIGRRWATFGKPGGTGLGLATSFEIVQKFGGNIDFKQRMKQGTTFTISLPKTFSFGYLSKITLRFGQNIFILDNDELFLSVWKQRLLEVSGTFKIQFGRAPHELTRWHKDNATKDTLYFIDYDLGPNKPTGLDLIEGLGIANHSILITGHYDNAAVLDRCQRLKVGIVPKDQIAALEIATLNEDLRTVRSKLESESMREPPL